MKYVKFTVRSRVAIFRCKQTALYGVGDRVFNEISEATEVSISVVKCLRNVLELIFCTEY